MGLLYLVLLLCFAGVLLSGVPVYWNLINFVCEHLEVFCCFGAFCLSGFCSRLGGCSRAASLISIFYVWLSVVTVVPGSGARFSFASRDSRELGFGSWKPSGALATSALVAMGEPCMCSAG